MAQEVNDQSVRQQQEAAPAPAPTEDEIVAQVVNDLFEADEEAALKMIDEKYGPWLQQQQRAGAVYQTLPGVLKNSALFFRAFLLGKFQMNYGEAQGLFEQAADGFGQLGQDELRELSLGFACSSGGLLEVGRANISLALDLTNKTKKHIQNAGKIGRMYEPMITLMERDALALSATQAVLRLDYPAAKALFEQTSQTAENFARKHFKEGTPLYNSHLGVAHYYRALSTFIQAYNRLNQLRCDAVADEKNLVCDAVQARELLSNGVPGDASIKRLAYVSDGFVNLLEVTHALARFMEKVFRSTVKPDAEAFQAMRNKIQAASDLFSKAGPEAVPYVRFCDDLNGRIDSIEKLTKPSRKDFGRVSGLVAAAAFLPLFLVTSWANKAFGVGVNSSTLVWYCLALALISGFGFGALRFKSLFTGGDKAAA